MPKYHKNDKELKSWTDPHNRLDDIMKYDELTWQNLQLVASFCSHPLPAAGSFEVDYKHNSKAL